MVLLLLSKMAQPFNLACPITNVTPLHVACEGNHFDVVLELVSRYPYLLFYKDKLSHRNWYPIHTACAYGASDSIIAVLLAGIVCMHINHKDQISQFSNVTFFDSFGRSPLYIAVKCGNSSHISLMTHPLLNLLHQCAPSVLSLTNGVSPSRVSAVHVTVLQSNGELLSYLLDLFPQAKCVLAYPGIIELKEMLKNMSVEKDLQATTICVSAKGELALAPFKNSVAGNPFFEMKLSPLALATALGNKAMVEILLQAGALDSDGLAVQFAHFTKHRDIVVNILLQQQILGSSEEDFVAEGMNLSSFPMSNFVLQHISQYTIIHLQNNKLAKLPVELFQLSALKQLDVSANILIELPTKDGWYCPSLKVLDINHNNLQELPGALWKLPKLKYLFAQHNNIQKIVDDEVTDVNMKVIDVSHNKLTKFPTFFASIKKVLISNNLLDSLPENIWSSKTIVHLDAAFNVIAGISFPQTDMGVKQRTESFTVQARKISGSDSSVNPPEGAHYANYRSKSMYASNLQAVSSLSVLKLGNNHLESFCVEINCFAMYLEELDLSYNTITSVDIRFLPPHIKSLNLKGCKMEKFGFLPEEDDDTFDKDCYFTGGICFHRRHTSLDFLIGLNLAENYLTKISFVEEGETLLYPNLQALDLSANRLSGEFAPNIEMFTKLQCLMLCDNVHLTSLSMKLSQLSKSLYSLKLDNLPNLRDPPMEYHSGPLQKMFSYMKSRSTK